MVRKVEIYRETVQLGSQALHREGDNGVSVASELDASTLDLLTVVEAD